MNNVFSTLAHPGTTDTATAPARVVAVEPGQVWLEPMQGGSCGGCASSASCGSKGIGTLASRLEARRFAIPGRFDLRVGEVVEVGFAHSHLVKAAAVAYAVPLLLALITAVLVQEYFAQDSLTLLGTLGGLLLGFVVSRLLAGRLEAQGALQATLLRRTVPDFQPIHFSPSGEQRDA
jgi:sigma-E factor negative regulatory protein RseC